MSFLARCFWSAFMEGRKIKKPLKGEKFCKRGQKRRFPGGRKKQCKMFFSSSRKPSFWEGWLVALHDQMMQFSSISARGKRAIHYLRTFWGVWNGNFAERGLHNFIFRLEIEWAKKNPGVRTYLQNLNFVYQFGYLLVLSHCQNQLTICVFSSLYVGQK